MLAQRVVSAIVLLAIVIPAAYLGGWYFFVVILAAGALAVYEMVGILHQAGLHPWLPALVSLTLGLAAAAQFSDLRLERPLLFLVLIAVSAWQLSRPVEARSLADWSLSVMPALYLGSLGGAVVLLRNAPHGWRWTLFMFFVVFTTDVAAYFGGRAFGRRQFAPTISPKKTWEGALIGWGYGGLMAIGLARFLQLPLTMGAALGLGLVVSVVASLGDLFMSYIKRQAHVKDSSHLIPGHGGILDRMDSILPAAAVVYLYIEWVAR
ncbi:MAG: phosphatidate cytidylyltransferase [Anaerolineae bacterium]|nr:phosphatidate cytidylyltransferase [Anaerolineae bacterium]